MWSKEILWMFYHIFQDSFILIVKEIVKEVKNIEVIICCRKKKLCS